jgi:hypothetical protein
MSVIFGLAGLRVLRIVAMPHYSGTTIVVPLLQLCVAVVVALLIVRNLSRTMRSPRGDEKLATLRASSRP